MRWALIYLALTLKPWEKVKYKMVNLIPRPLSVELDENKERWYYRTPLNLLNQEQKKEIMATVISQMVKITFETHIYEWDGEIYSREDGCPAGLRPNGPISRKLMDHWVQNM